MFPSEWEIIASQSQQANSLFQLFRVEISSSITSGLASGLEEFMKSKIGTSTPVENGPILLAKVLFFVHLTCCLYPDFPPVLLSIVSIYCNHLAKICFLLNVLFLQFACLFGDYDNVNLSFCIEWKTSSVYFSNYSPACRYLMYFQT